MSINATSLGAARNGMPETARYVYGRSPARLRRRVEQLIEEDARRNGRQRLLDDLSGGPDIEPDYQTWREAQEAAEEPPAVIEPPRPAADARCETCGYLETRCSCPGGPRG